MNFLQMLYGRLIGTAADVIIWADDQIDAALASLVRVIIFVFGMLLLGTIVGLFFPSLARYIFAIDYFLGGFLMLIFAARFGVLMAALPGIYGAVRLVVRETTEALPFTNGIDLPEGLSASQVETAWRIVWATLATLQVLAGYALVFPVYTNPLSFLAVMGAGWGILYGALGNVEEGGKWLRHYCLMHVVFSVILLVAFTLSFPYPNLWNNLVARSETIWTSLFTMEHLAAINYPMAVIWFIAVVGSLISVGVAFYVRNAAGFSIAVIFVVMLLFLIFLGQRTVDAASNLHDASGTTQAPTVSGDLRSGNIASSGELNPSQPYYANPTGKLVNGEAYKYPNVNTVYMYENGKFRPFKDDLTYYAHYGCHRNQRVIDCHRVEEIPAGIDVHATKYKGEIVTS